MMSKSQRLDSDNWVEGADGEGTKRVGTSYHIGMPGWKVTKPSLPPSMYRQ